MDQPAEEPTTPPPSERTRLRRYHWLGQYERKVIDGIIDAGFVCQVGYVIDGQPYVTPTNHWRIGDYVYWHGSSAEARMLKAQTEGIPVCFSVTHLDGVVFSRAAFNHNINFRSVMAFGRAEFVEEEEKRHALAVFTIELAPGLWTMRGSHPAGVEGNAGHSAETRRGFGEGPHRSADRR